MLTEEIFNGAVKDGVDVFDAKILVAVYQDKSILQMCKDFNKPEASIRTSLVRLYHYYNVKSKTKLIVKCAPYLQGHSVKGLMRKAALEEKNAIVHQKVG